jgi:two-component system, OmpR family, sensor histidine kinase KdpD
VLAGAPCRAQNTADVERSLKAEQLLAEIGGRPRLVVYVAAAPGAGKTRRLLNEGVRLQAGGKRVFIGWIETKGRLDLEELAATLPRIPARRATVNGSEFSDFDFEAAVRERPDVVLLDELAHENLPGGAHVKRWQDAEALRAAGIGTIGALNVAHLESVAPTVESLLGYPVREIVPLSFLKSADEVVALDVSPRLLRGRVKAGKVVDERDVERALNGIFEDRTLASLRELLLRTVDRLTLPTLKASGNAFATALVYPDHDPTAFLKRTSAIAHALDLELEIIPTGGANRGALEATAREVDGEVLREMPTPAFDNLKAALVALPSGRDAARLANLPLSYDLFIGALDQAHLGRNAAFSPYSNSAADRMRVGYGRLSVYLGPAAGSGKTFAMLDRAHQLQDDGVDVVAAFVETHGRAETVALLDGLEVLPPRTVTAEGIIYRELDRDALLARKPQVALIDELAHTNAPGSVAPKRFFDVLSVLRAGIDVITTLNVQHLEGLADSVRRRTGATVRETLPDGILSLADEIVSIDITPEALRQRLREGKIYPSERIDSALENFFRTEHLEELRELALREALHGRYRDSVPTPFDRILLTLGPNSLELPLVARAGRMAARLSIEFTIVHVTDPKEPQDAKAVAAVREHTNKTNVEWIEETHAQAPRRVIEIARAVPETVVVVPGTKRKPRLLSRKSFARQLLDAGALELLVLARSS